MTDRYLGDGVYASFDGYQIWLAANHHDNKVIALDPHVMAALSRYWKDLLEKEAEQRRAEQAQPEADPAA